MLIALNNLLCSADDSTLIARYSGQIHNKYIINQSVLIFLEMIIRFTLGPAAADLCDQFGQFIKWNGGGMD